MFVSVLCEFSCHKTPTSSSTSRPLLPHVMSLSTRILAAILDISKRGPRLSLVVVFAPFKKKNKPFTLQQFRKIKTDNMLWPDYNRPKVANSMQCANWNIAFSIFLNTVLTLGIVFLNYFSIFTNLLYLEKLIWVCNLRVDLLNFCLPCGIKGRIQRSSLLVRFSLLWIAKRRFF